MFQKLYTIYASNHQKKEFVSKHYTICFNFHSLLRCDWELQNKI